MVKQSNPVNLVEELYKFAVDHARCSANQPFEADDFLQEILLVFLEVADRYADKSKEELVALAKTSARNRVRDLVKARNVRFKYHVALEDFRDTVVLDEDRLRIAKNMVEHVDRMIDGRMKRIKDYLYRGLTVREVAKLENLSAVSIGRYIQNLKLTVQINLPEEGA